MDPLGQHTPRVRDRERTLGERRARGGRGVYEAARAPTYFERSSTEPQEDDFWSPKRATLRKFLKH